MKKSAFVLILTALMLTSPVYAEETKAPPMKVVVDSGEDETADDSAITEDASVTDEEWEDDAEKSELEELANAPTYANFVKSKTYTDGIFADVKTGDWFAANGPDCNAVVGISGGKDSSIVAALCVEALGKDMQLVRLCRTPTFQPKILPSRRWK